jgi:inorganic phosphate transporter, PiT family
MIILLFAAACFLAFSNGANDNFKGVATLFGSGTTSYKSAISWATVTTLMGSLAAIFLAGILVKNFSGKGLVPDALLLGPEFAISVAIGASLTVFIATRIGMPISTTHGLVGALFGSGVVAVGTSFNFAKLGSAFLIPLLVSPLMAAVLSLLAYFIFRKGSKAMGLTKTSCVCVGKEYIPVHSFQAASIPIGTLTATTATTLKVDSAQNCVDVYQNNFMGIKMQRLLDVAHYLSAGIVSFARGLNDTPKIAGLLLVVQAYDIRWGLGLLAVAIAVGGLTNARKVGETMGKKITPMSHGQGFAANMVTGLLVTTASIHGMPVSTTHVSVGSIFGIGSVTKGLDLRVVKNILLSWLLTLPLAAIIAGMVYAILQVI